MAKKILVIDNDFKELAEIRATLEKERYEVIEAVGALEALDAPNITSFDLVCLGAKMTILSGYDLLPLFLEKLNKDIPIIYLTDSKDNLSLRKIDGFVQKPFEPEILLGEVKRCLNCLTQ